MLRWYGVRFKRGFVAQVLGFDRTLRGVASDLGVPVSTGQRRLHCRAVPRVSSVRSRVFR